MIQWRRPSRCDSATCVEIAVVEEMEVVMWRKSTRSSGNGACVEVASVGRAVLVRDSKRPEGGYLTATPAAWTTLMASIRRGELDL